MAVTATALVFFTFVATPQQTARVTSFGGGGSGRTDLWTVGWRMVEAHPVRGIGVGQFQQSSVHYLIAPGAILRSDLIVRDLQDFARREPALVLGGAFALGFLAARFLKVGGPGGGRITNGG